MKSSSHTKKAARRQKTPPEDLKAEEAIEKLDGFIAELETNWKRDGLEWALDFLVLLRGFSTEAHKDGPDMQQMAILQAAIGEFIENRKFLKGVEFVLEWADAVSSEMRG